MSIIFGTNTVMSTWRNAVPLMCPPKSHLLSEKVRRTIKEARELGIEMAKQILASDKAWIKMVLKPQ